VSAVFGEPIERDGVTVIPVARVSLGFGVGAGTRQRESQIGDGGGGGGGAAAVPLGYIEIKDGTAQFKASSTHFSTLPCRWSLQCSARPPHRCCVASFDIVEPEGRSISACSNGSA
jgi:hypothetical protein